MLNPWVRTEQGEAQTYLRHYYLKRLFSRTFWSKLLRGGLRIGQAITELSGAVSKAHGLGLRVKRAEQPLPARVSMGLRSAGLPFLIILSGRDYVAREFEESWRSNPAWSKLQNDFVITNFEDADHTFSSAKDCERVAITTIEWCCNLKTPSN